MLQILEFTEGRIIAAKATGKFSESDYYKLLPLFINRLKQYPRIRLYFEMGDLEGMELKGSQEDVEFNGQLARSFEKVAMLGDNNGEQWVTDLIRSFTSAEVKYFDTINRDEAIKWIKS